MNSGQKLRELMGRPGLNLCPVIGDPLSARLAQRAQIPMVLLGGLGISAMRLGLPDAGLMSSTEVVDQLRNTCAAVPGYPIVADADTGYGNAVNVRRTVFEFGRAGAAAMFLEDQIWPKKCGHYGGDRRVISRDEARTKIRAAVEARNDAGFDMMIVGRTDSHSAISFEEALTRCKMFQDEGADMLFIEAMKSRDQLERFAKAMSVPTWASMLPKTPFVPRQELEQMGIRILVHNVVLPAALSAIRTALTNLRDDRIADGPEMLTFEEFTDIVGLPEYLEFEKRYAIVEK